MQLKHWMKKQRIGTGIESARSITMDDIDMLSGIVSDADKIACNSEYGIKYKYYYKKWNGVTTYLHSRYLEHGKNDEEQNWSAEACMWTQGSFITLDKTIDVNKDEKDFIILKNEEYLYSVQDKGIFSLKNDMLNILFEYSFYWIASPYISADRVNGEYYVPQIQSGLDYEITSRRIFNSNRNK